MRVTLLLGLLVITTSVWANENKVVGVWLTQDKDSKIEISRNDDGTFSGKVIWLKNPLKDGQPQVDKENPDEALQDRPILGLELLQGFKFDEDEWNSGTIYDPKTGNTYKCYMWFDKDDNTLHVKGYIGISIIGRSVEWTRVK